MVLKPVGIEDDGSFVGRAADWLRGTFSRKSAFRVDIRDFGAALDGTTDDTAAWNAAIDFANAQQPTPVDANNVKGVVIWVPAGRTKITGQLHAITRSGVNIVGESENGSVLLLSGTEATFTWGTVTTQLVVGGGMAHLKIEYLSAPAVTAAAVVVSYGTRLNFSHILLANVGTFLLLGTSSTMFASAIWLSNVGGYMHNTGGALIIAQHGAGLIIENCKFFVGGILTPATNRTSLMTTLAGTNGITLGAGSWDTVQITGSFFERFYNGIEVITGAGPIVNNVFISNTYFDYIRQSCILLNASSNVSGGIAGFNISNCWFASWEGSGISVGGPGLMRGISIENCRMASAGEHSVLVSGASREVTIRGCHMNGSNRLNVFAMGVALFGGSHVNIANNVIGYDSSWGGYAWQPYAGVSVAANLDYIQIHDNDVSGATLNFDITANTAASVNRQIRDNVGANYAGVHSVTLPASGVAGSNTTPHTWDLHIHGGTVTAIAKNGSTVGGMTSGHLTVGPGESFTVTYSSAPTVTAFYRA